MTGTTSDILSSLNSLDNLQNNQEFSTVLSDIRDALVDISSTAKESLKTSQNALPTLNHSDLEEFEPIKSDSELIKDFYSKDKEGLNNILKEFKNKFPKSN